MKLFKRIKSTLFIPFFVNIWSWFVSAVYQPMSISKKNWRLHKQHIYIFNPYYSKYMIFVQFKINLKNSSSIRPLTRNHLFIYLVWIFLVYSMICIYFFNKWSLFNPFLIIPKTNAQHVANLVWMFLSLPHLFKIRVLLLVLMELCVILCNIFQCLDPCLWNHCPDIIHISRLSFFFNETSFLLQIGVWRLALLLSN